MHSLQLRFMLVVLAGAALFAALAGSFAYRLGHEHALESGRATIDGLVDAVEKTAAIGAFTTDRQLLGEVIGGLARSPLVAGVQVRAASGTVLAQRGRLDKSSLSVERSLASPFDAAETVGRLRIVADTGRLEAAARSEAGLQAWLMVGQTALVALLLYVAAARLVSRPIVQLGRGLQAMQPGTSERLFVPAGHAHDEIGDLIRSANSLLAANEFALQRERELRAEIEAMEAQYRQIFDASSAGIFVLDPRGRLINSNPTALRVIGLPMERLRQLQGEDFVQQVFARPERVRQMMRDAGHRGETVSTDLELLQLGEQPRWVHCLISVQGAAADSRLIEGVMYDITERKRAEHAARHQADHDSLTGLRNRHASEATIERLVAEALATQSATTVLYIDLDGFKRVNDTLGHKAGDQVLLACAQRMQATVRRASDLVGRIGGDEFVIALGNIACADAMVGQLASALLATLCAPIEIDFGRTVQVGASIGIASFPRHGSTRKQLMHAADAAMYEVKRSGKNTFAVAAEASTVA
jgi:diguanylate cyclase (GGDEF)-like protein/PAS domain S-box-containing protein